MKRVTISVSDELEQQLIAFADSKGYGNRSEACRGISCVSVSKGTKGRQAGTLAFALRPSPTSSTKTRAVWRSGCPKLITRTTSSLSQTCEFLSDHESCLDVIVLRGEVAGAPRVCSENHNAWRDDGNEFCRCKRR